MKNNKGQEEMIGFGVIIVLVAVILLVFLWFFLSNQGDQEVDSYETESFVESLVQVTSNCESYRQGKLEIEDLLFYCEKGLECLDERDSCKVLNETLYGILQSSWNVGEESPAKGYYLNVSVGSEVIVLQEGNITSTSRIGESSFSRPDEDARIWFQTYY